MVSRLEVRLDDEQRQRLEEIAEEQDASISEVVRRLIDDAWEGIMLERRRQLVREIASDGDGCPGRSPGSLSRAGVTV